VVKVIYSRIKEKCPNKKVSHFLGKSGNSMLSVLGGKGHLDGKQMMSMAKQAALGQVVGGGQLGVNGAMKGPVKMFSGDDQTNLVAKVNNCLLFLAYLMIVEEVLEKYQLFTVMKNVHNGVSELFSMTLVAISQQFINC